MGITQGRIGKHLREPALRAVFFAILGSGIATADTIAYGITDSNNEWGTLDLNTGVYTSIGQTLLEPGAQIGVGVANGNYYAAAWTSSVYDLPTFNSMEQVNPSSGSTVPGTFVGLPLDVMYSPLGSLGSNSNSLYFLVNGQLFTVNASNGDGTSIGQSSLTGDPALSVSADSTSLFALVAGASDFLLYGLGPATAAATLIGDTSIPVTSGVPAALLFANGTLWATMNGADYTVDLTTGKATLVAQITGVPPYYSLPDYISGLAPDVSTVTSAPEPSTWSILVLATGIAVAFGRRFPLRKGPVQPTGHELANKS